MIFNIIPVRRRLFGILFGENFTFVGVETRHALSLRPFLIILFFHPFYISNHQLDRGVTVEIIFL